MNKYLSAALAFCMTKDLVILPTVVLGSAMISINAVVEPAQASTFTKVRKIARKVCEIGGCFYIIEQVVERFQTSSDAPDCSLSAKGCTTRTGGSAVKIGETRTIIRKVRIR